MLFVGASIGLILFAVYFIIALICRIIILNCCFGRYTWDEQIFDNYIDKISESMEYFCCCFYEKKHYTINNMEIV